MRDAHHTDGVGLGLAIVQTLASNLGHGLRVASRCGRGSVFALRLPVALEPAPVSDPPADDERGRVLAGRRLLVLDDDGEVRAATAALLCAWGGDVLSAASGAQATALVDECATRGEAIDLLLIDERLGGGPAGQGNSGSAWLAAWRARGPAPPALLLSADATPALRAAAAACDALLIGKPLTPVRLRSVVTAVLKPPQVTIIG